MGKFVLVLVTLLLMAVLIYEAHSWWFKGNVGPKRDVNIHHSPEMDEEVSEDYLPSDMMDKDSQVDLNEEEDYEDEWKYGVKWYAEGVEVINP